jgi:hypothetical protein
MRDRLRPLKMAGKNGGLMLISCGFHGLMLVKWWLNGG